MNYVQSLIDRQLGFYSRLNYDSVLRRLSVLNSESFYGLSAAGAGAGAEADHDPPIFACRFAETRGYEHVLALANEDGRVAIQNVSVVGGTSCVESFQCHNNAVFDLAWTPGRMSFVTVSGDHTACLWDLAQGQPRSVMIFSSHTKSVKTAVFRPAEPSVFATGARDGHILVWDTRASNQPAVVLKPDNCLMHCHSGLPPKTPGSGKRPRADAPRAVSITGLVFQDDLTLLSCGECDGNIKVWDLRKNYSTYTREPLPKHSIPYCGSSTRNGYTNLIVDDARIRLYASCMDDVIYCFNISTYNSLPEQRYVGHENRTFYIKTSLSPDCMYLVSGSSDKNAYIWNVRCSQPVVRLRGHWAEVTCAAWGRGAALVTCSDDARHKIWRIGPEFPDLDPDPAGGRPARAEPVSPKDAAALPRWGLDRTPSSLKRHRTPTPGRGHSAKRQRIQEVATARKTKRCLTDLMNASRETDEAETSVKRPKVDLPTIPEQAEPTLLSAGTKRRREDAEYTSPTKDCLAEASALSSDWRYLPSQTSTSFLTPTKNYEKKTCRIISPKSPRSRSAHTHPATVTVSPSKVRVLSFTTPTKNLPNYVVDGAAPHLRLMSPPRKKQGSTDWLTRLVREKKGRADVAEASPAPCPPAPSPAPALARRSSLSEKSPKPSTVKSRTLLKYFSVSSKEK